MDYFIPAWYSSNKWWESNYRPFQQINRTSDFDEIISLISMYIKNKKKYKIISLSYSPNLRLFLHRYSMFESNYWSIFDEIQGFHHSTPVPIDYKDLDWPKNTEFSYTPYIIIGNMTEKQQSNIYYSEEGYMVWIEDLVNGIKQRRYVFDDRGYLSSIVYFDERGKALTVDYLTIEGKEILTENIIDGSVRVHQDYCHQFSKKIYHSMADIIEERLSCYINNQVMKEDAFIVASDNRHNEIVARVVKTDKKIFTIFNRRNQKNKRNINYQSFSKKWIADTIENEELLKYKDVDDVLRVTPFDAFLIPNRSSQLVNTEIGVYIEDIEEQQLLNLMDIFDNYLMKSKNIKIIFFSRIEMSHFSSRFKDKIDAINNKFIGNIDIDNITDEELINKEVMQFVNTPLEEDIIQIVSNLRLVIDLNKEPDLFLQICSISAGIPQINKSSTDYVVDRMNGYLLYDYKNLPEALDFFINTLKNWNSSYAYCLKLSEEYSSFNIINRITQFIVGDKNDS